MNMKQEEIYNNVNAFTTTMEIIYNNGVKKFVMEELIKYLDEEKEEDIKEIIEHLGKVRFEEGKEFNLSVYLTLSEYMDIKEEGKE